jgi:ABC-type uncharacterized transport system substrate-binding protein
VTGVEWQVDRDREKDMKKKITVLIPCTLLFALCSYAEAQQAKKVPRIGLIRPGPAQDPNVDAFRQGLREFGHVEGKNIAIEYRAAEGKLDRLPPLAAELVGLNIDMIVVGGDSAIRAARQATHTIPIVMANASDPVTDGFVASLARPGGNITGLSRMGSELSGKRLELLKETTPKASRVAILWDPTDPGTPAQFRETETVTSMKSLLSLI